MSFRLFVYYCAVGGAWCGFIGWLIGILIAPASQDSYFRYVLRTSLVAMFLGVTVAFGLSFLDATFNLSLRQFGKVFLRVAAAVVIGIFGGLFGGFVGGSLYYVTQGGFIAPVAYIIGWTIVGFLVGMSISFFEVLASFMTGKDVGSAFKKIIKCLIGGTVGGILGGVIALTLRFIASFQSLRSVDDLLTPIALGFIAIGACIGLLVGLAQVLLKEAWIKVEAGFRPGREMLLAKAKTTIGRAEGSDIGLFGDSTIEKEHASIVLDGGRYFVEDMKTPSGTYVNDKKVEGRTALKTGDLIRVGKSVLRFNERAKRKD